MVLEITFLRLLFLVVRNTFLGCGIGYLLNFLISLIEKEKVAATIYLAVMFVCLSVFLLLGLLSPCIH